MGWLSPEIEAAIRARGMPTDPFLFVHRCAEGTDALRLLGRDAVVEVRDDLTELIRGIRSHSLSAVLAGDDAAMDLLQALTSENQTVGVIAHCPGGSSRAIELRSHGVMEVVSELSVDVLRPLFVRAFDYRTLLALELAHRCESRRLLRREQELLGEAPDQLSDDLNTFQPPALPVGPLSVYNLEEASEAFERSYIDRVQQLSASAREAAVHLGVSSATLSRRLRREGASDAP